MKRFIFLLLIMLPVLLFGQNTPPMEPYYQPWYFIYWNDVNGDTVWTSPVSTKAFVGAFALYCKITGLDVGTTAHTRPVVLYRLRHRAMPVGQYASYYKTAGLPMVIGSIDTSYMHSEKWFLVPIGGDSSWVQADSAQFGIAPASADSFTIRILSIGQ